jgi:hypothetical protein
MPINSRGFAMSWRFIAPTVNAIERGWSALIALAGELWPLRFIVVILAALTIVLQVDQARDVLYHVFAEAPAFAGHFDPLVFVLAVIFLAIQSWYWGRFLFIERLRKQDDAQDGPAPSLSGRDVWTPRLLGGLVFWIAAFSVWRSGSMRASLLPWVAGFLLAGPVFVWLTALRRAQMNRVAGRHGGARRIVAHGPAFAHTPAVIGQAAVWWIAGMVLMTVTAYVPPWSRFAVWYRDGAVAVVLLGSVAGTLLLVRSLQIPRPTKWMVGGLSLLNAGFFAFSVFLPVPVGTALGAGPVLIVAAAVLVGGTGFFVAYPSMVFGLPVTVILLLLIAVSAMIGEGPFYDNHAVRSVGSSVLTDQQIGSRQTLEAALADWKTQANCASDGSACPMVIVAAEGGASRSAYWSAMILGALEDAHPGFHRSVFALSGVSGGSLGIAVYAELVRRFPTPEMLPCGKEPGASKGSYARCAQEMLQSDFLGPTFFSMFNADLVQRLLPGAALPDRATALETSWEAAWSRIAAGAADKDARAAFSQPLQFRPRPDHDWTPILLLNGTSEKTGRRIITSDIAISPGCGAASSRASDFVSTGDFFCLTRRPVRLSTAIHNSARFPYVSPAGTLWANSSGHSWKADRIVDGGYFEVHAAFTTAEVLARVAWGSKLQPVILSLENDIAPPVKASGEEAAFATAVGPEATRMPSDMRYAHDLLSPLIGLVSARAGHGDYAMAMLDRDASNVEGNDRLVHLNIEVGLDGAPPVDPAMSWFLSDRSIGAMRQGWCYQVPRPGAAPDPFERELQRLVGFLSLPAAPNAQTTAACVKPPGLR